MDSLLLCNLYDETGWYFVSLCRPGPTTCLSNSRQSWVAEAQSDYWHSSYRVVGLGRQLLIPVKAVNMWSATGLWHSLLWPWTVCFILYSSGTLDCFILHFWVIVLINDLLEFWLSSFARDWDRWSDLKSLLHTNSIKVTKFPNIQYPTSAVKKGLINPVFRQSWAVSLLLHAFFFHIPSSGPSWSWFHQSVLMESLISIYRCWG